jgi:hypothetical protein
MPPDLYCFSYFPDMVLCFYLELALDSDPTYAYDIVGIIHWCHHTQLIC